MTSAKRILLVDDDHALRQSLAEQLRQEFETAEAGDALSAAAMAVAGNFSAILLDIDLPDGSGCELSRHLRREGVRCPILLMAGSGCHAGMLSGSGANDLLVKPFRLGVLLSRLKILLRQYERCGDAEMTIGPYAFNPVAKHLTNAATNKRIRLTEKEAEILAYLYKAEKCVVTRDALLGEVWGYNARVTTHTLETHVYRLRQKIEHDPAHAEILVTEAGGYRLIP